MASNPGEAIEGPLEGKQIEMFPVVWTTWGKAKVRYPNAQVLDRPSASRRPYGKDPYGSYQRPPTYYQNDQILYPVMHVDRSLHPKEPVLGIKMETLRLAIVKRSVAAMGVANIDIGMVPLVALYDPGLDAIRIFQRQTGNKTLNFLMQDNKIYDRESMTEWTPDGKGAYGRYRDQQLTQVPAMEVMWFAWTAFYPDTAIFR